MADRQALTFAFLRTHPADAAMTLDSALPEQVSSLLAETPVRVAAPVLAQMSAARAAAALQRLPATRASELLAGLGTQSSVRVLRHLPEVDREKLIDGLPTAAAVGIRLLLSFPRDSVGALADPAVVTASSEMSAADAIRQVHVVEGSVGFVLLLDDAKRVVGWVGLDVLLRAPESSILGTLAESPPLLLPAAMPLSGAMTSPAWLRVSVLPVVDRGHRLVGMLTHDALARAAELAARDASPGDGQESLVGMLSRTYLLSVMGLLQACTFWLPRVASIDGRKHDH